MDLTGLGTRHLVQVHVSVPQEKCTLQSVPSSGETGRIPERDGFSSCQEHPPKPISQGQGASSSSPSQPSWGIFLAALLSETPPGARYRESAAAPRWEPNTVSNGGSTDFPGGPVAKTPNAGGLGLIPGQGTRSHLPHLKIPSASPKIPHVAMKMPLAATKTWYSKKKKQQQQQHRISEV